MIEKVDLPKNRNILRRITSVDADTIVPIISPDEVALKVSAYRANDGVVTVEPNFYLKELIAKSSIRSILAPPPPEITDEDSDSQALTKVIDYEWNSPGKRLQLLSRIGDGDWEVIEEIALLGNTGYPYRTYNLMDTLTDNLAFYLEGNSALAVRMVDAGQGLLEGEDNVVIRGSFTEEIIVTQAQPMLSSISPSHWLPFVREGMELVRDTPTGLTVKKGGVTAVSSSGERRRAQFSQSQSKTLAGTELSDGWHHVFVTWNPNSLLTDWQTDTDPNGSNLDDALFKRWIGAYLVESGEIANFHHDGEWFVWKPARISYSGPIPTTDTPIALDVPPGFECRAQLACHAGHSSSGAANDLLIALADGNGLLPVALIPPYASGANVFAYASNLPADVREFNSNTAAFQTDASQNIQAKRAGNYLSAGYESTLQTLRWKRAGGF